MNPDVIKASLQIMWQGLLAIFVVIALIIIVVQLTVFFINQMNKIKADVEKEVEESDKY
jgi:Na+-transporting methylmalonyl-CoA/oxaloacetate decarboxylase gamma subunit